MQIPRLDGISFSLPGQAIALRASGAIERSTGAEPTFLAFNPLPINQVAVWPP